jgi:hypothetical protein
MLKSKKMKGKGKENPGSFSIEILLPLVCRNSFFAASNNTAEFKWI